MNNLAIAASNPDNWRVLDGSEPPKTWHTQADYASAMIDQYISEILDLTPESLGFEATRLCEVMIQPNTETDEHIDTMTKLLSLIPSIYHKRGMDAMKGLMRVARRQVHSWSPPACADTYIAKYHGWI